MHRISIAAAAAFLSIAAAPAKPAFEFKGIVAGQNLPSDAFKGCRTTGAETSCSKFDDTIGGARAFTSIDAYNGRLTSVIAVIDRDDFPQVLAAVQSKYGSPCRVEKGVWQNAAGASLDNPKMVWCFATGELSLKQISSSLRNMEFIYWDDVQPPKAAPKVDF